MWTAPTTPPTPPTGWLLCHGQAISSSEYPELYAIVGATVPDMRGRFPLGYGGTTGPTGAAIAATTKLSGGAIRYTYTSAAGHTHNMNAFNIAAFNASTSITEGSAKSNTGNHSHGVTGNTAANTANVNAFFPNTGTLRAFSDDAHTHADGNLVTNSWGGQSANGADQSSHTHSMNAFTASTSITEGAITEGTAIAQTASTASLDITPPYYSVAFIIYSGRA
jgi:microcystin-dependent protein